MSITNKTRYIKRHETFKCKCRLDASVCNNKQRWDKDRCRCDCKELIGKGRCGKGFIWNPSNCGCECDKFVMLMNIQTMNILNAKIKSRFDPNC